MQAESDLFLWQQFRAGDGAALEHLMGRHFRTLYHYGTKFSGDGEFIKDCVQDLFLDLWDRRQSLHEEVILKAYLMASLRRRIHRAAQTKKRFIDGPVDDCFSGFDLELSVEEAFIEQEAARSTAHEVKSHLQSLPKRQKEVIYLKFFEGLDRDATAEVMGINAQSVSNLLQAAYKHLKATLKSEHYVFFALTFIL